MPTILWPILIGFVSVCASNGEISEIEGAEPVTLWPTKRIPYVMKRSLFPFVAMPVSAVTSRIRTALQTWEDKTCIRFKEKPSWTTVPHVLIDTFTPGCKADVGFQNIPEGQTFLYTYGDCGQDSMILHQLGHVIGLRYDEIQTDRYIYPSVDTQNSVAALYHNFLREQMQSDTELSSPRDGINSSTLQGIHGTHTGMMPSEPTGLTEAEDGRAMADLEKTPNFHDFKSVNLLYGCSGSCSRPTGLHLNETTAPSPFDCQNEGYLFKQFGICLCQCPFPFKVGQTSLVCDDFEGETHHYSLRLGDVRSLTLNSSNSLSTQANSDIMTVFLKAEPSHFIKVQFGEDCQIGSGDGVKTRRDCMSEELVDVRLGQTGIEGMKLCGKLSNLELTTQTAGDSVLVLYERKQHASHHGGSACEIKFTSVYDDCKSSPCYNGGTCTSLEMGGFICECPLEITGQHCEQIDATAVSCDFESVCEFLTVTTSANFSVALAHTAYRFNNTEPVRPTGADNSHFVFGPTKVDEDGSATFRSLGHFSDIGSGRCLSLDWFIGRPESGSEWTRNSRIEIIKRSGNGGAEVVYRKIGRTHWSSRWRHIERDLVNDPFGFELVIKLAKPRIQVGGIVYKNSGVIAIDNFEVHHQPCSDRCDEAYCMNGGICYRDENHSPMCRCPTEYSGPTCKSVGLNRTCTFENGVCHFFFPEQTSFDLNFTRQDALSVRNSRHNHVLGAEGSRHYMSLEPPHGVAGNYVSVTSNGTVYTIFNGKFKTASLGIVGPICVEFYYYLSGNYRNGIRVSHQLYGPTPARPVLAYRTSQIEPGWNHLRIDTTALHVKDRISFRGWRIVAPGNVVGYDNINILEGSC